MHIILDAMGGDNGPAATAGGALAALEKSPSLRVTLVGEPAALTAALSGYTGDRLAIVPSSEVIEMDDPPALVVRRKKDSSMVVAMNMLARGEGDALLSTGSTGALLTAGLLIIKCVPGVHRPALTPILPTLKTPCALIDCGANVDCRPIHLCQFAVMGRAYMQALGVADPRVGLINIGVESEKGNELTRTVHPQLAQMPINFVGNIEAREIPSGDADVLVCDAFVGNVALKLIEGMGSAILSMLKTVLTAKLRFKLAAAVLKPAFRSFKKKMSYEEYGGAPLLGLRALVLKTHGSATEKAVCAALLQTERLAAQNLPGKIASAIEAAGAQYTRADA